VLDELLERLTCHLHWRTRYGEDPRLPRVAQKARDYLHAHAQQDIGLAQLAAATGVDRFRLTRAFKAAYGLAPHAYLVQLQLRLVKARQGKARLVLADGEQPEAKYISMISDEKYFYIFS
jgi:AraC-like DNA-binding protein